MKIAALDLGSNSIHLVIVEVAASGGFQVIDREKEMVRLGASTLVSGHLSASAVKRGLEVITKYQRLAETHGVDKIIAVATSAVREAGNGEDFLEAVGRSTRIFPRAISGEEEARLIYLAALHSIHLEGRRAVVIDIGGGSVELALGAGGELETAASVKLGVLRMTERFVKTDPLSAKHEGRLVAHVEETLGPQLEAIRTAGFDVAVGTSGTILTLGAMAQAMEGEGTPDTLHHLTVRTETLRALRKRLVASDLRSRLRIPGMDAGRADLMVAGAVILETILARLGVEELTLCEWALREGILIDYIHGHPRSLARAEAYPDVRRRSVVELAERCLYDEPHARQVATLSLALFDGTRRHHGLGDEPRRLLEYAALLHDVGHHISYPGHHKHTYYLIKNGDLRGFHPLEIEQLANVARYHRRGHPRRKHAAFAGLPRAARRQVRLLAGFLRVADALDRSHRQVVRALTVSERGRALRVRCRVDGNFALEQWGLRRRAELLQEALGLELRLDVEPLEKVAPASWTGRLGKARA